MINDCIYYHFLNSLLDGNKRDCKKLVSELMDSGVDSATIYNDLIQRSMYRIGHLWENNKLSISKEHIASQIIRQLLENIHVKNNGVAYIGKKAVISCVEKEFHEIGAKIISDYLEQKGYEVFFLGANVPANDIIKTVEDLDPDIVGISSNFYINIIRLTKLIEEINYKFPQKEILIGGQALLNYDPDVLHKFQNVHYLPSIEYLEDYLVGKFHQ